MAKQGKEKGLLVIYTGHGKGKTTAALGMSLRAVGWGHKVCILQFIKGSWKYGELKGIKRLAPEVELRTVGQGFVGIIDDDKPIEEHRKAAREGLAEAREVLASGAYDIVILDELSVALQLKLVDQSDVESMLEAKNDQQHLVITGRDAPDWLIERADLVTEMREIKHPFQAGIEAQKGVDW